MSIEENSLKKLLHMYGASSYFRGIELKGEEGGDLESGRIFIDSLKGEQGAGLRKPKKYSH